MFDTRFLNDYEFNRYMDHLANEYGAAEEELKMARHVGDLEAVFEIRQALAEIQVEINKCKYDRANAQMHVYGGIIND